MIFVSTLDVIPGRIDDLRKIIKTLDVPSDIKIREFLTLFGKPDFLVTFEAPDEETAIGFILRFTSAAVPKTSVGVPVEKI
ncbi:hypothetical protein A2Y85_05930 [candidate division WOR-3 bacterium RBG_13_43_14]|uniref:Transcription regulator AsnC/Lrp ligand binding domain-containing protein n=1 Tax=candidate division WOR-3 bacterium RBG_13_43_14 TaxID=1802590 RepID=A0A1F4U973_UNCW3|nr:MAG: hypothetical protein A2Y85_05930 [candidate division WOR-3 bacterium RBG_13_43_14]